jgi:hypothetical protein
MNGTLLLEVLMKRKQILLKANLFGSYPIHSMGDTKLISSQWVLRSDCLDGLSHEKILPVFARQSISKTYRLIRKRDNKILPHCSTIYMKPMWCFHCQRFGCSQQWCILSLFCDEGGYGEARCSNMPGCINCIESHPSSYKKCQVTRWKTHCVLGRLNLRQSESCVSPLHRLWEVDVSTKTAAISMRGNSDFFRSISQVSISTLMYFYLFIFLLLVFSLCWSVQSLCAWCKCTFVPPVCHIQSWTLHSSAAATWYIFVHTVVYHYCFTRPYEMLWWAPLYSFP